MRGGGAMGGRMGGIIRLGCRISSTRRRLCMWIMGVGVSVLILLDCSWRRLGEDEPGVDSAVLQESMSRLGLRFEFVAWILHSMVGSRFSEARDECSHKCLFHSICRQYLHSSRSSVQRNEVCIQPMLSFLVLILILMSTNIFFNTCISNRQTSRPPSSVDLDLDRDGALLRLQHNQVVVVSKVLDGSVDKLGPGDNLQSDQRRHEVDFAIRQAVKNESQHKFQSKIHQQEKEITTYFSPIQLLPPLPKASSVFCSL
jgi:hypothetical protein